MQTAYRRSGRRDCMRASGGGRGDGESWPVADAYSPAGRPTGRWVDERHITASCFHRQMTTRNASART